eukprot:9226867-Pyramimonas_sp.AAC.1
MLPQHLTETLISQGPHLRMGARLQHISCRARRDHVPVHATFRFPLRQRVRHQPQPPKWNRDGLVQAVRNGYHHAEFIQNIESQRAQEWISFSATLTRS